MQTPLNYHVPAQVSFECRLLRFGMMAREDDAMFNPPQYEYRDVCLVFQFSKRSVLLTFNVDLGSWGVKFYKIPIGFAHIGKMIRVNDKEDGCALVIQLPSPPELWSERRDAQKARHNNRSARQERESWQREVEITHQPFKAKTSPAQLIKNRKTVDLARWTTYYLDMPASVATLLDRYGIRLRDYNVKIASIDRFDLVEPGQSVFDLLKLDPDMKSFDCFNAVHLPFEIRYQLEVCISQGLLNEYSMDRDFLNKLLTDDAGKPREPDRVRMMLEGVADQNKPYYRPADILEDPKILRYWPSTRLPSQAALVRRAVITPTGMYLKTPSVELTNRILRKYSDLTDRFLRVQFTDELSFGKIWSCQGSKQSDEVYLRVLRVMLNGIVIGDRHYKILAWSNSQFREHGAFFFCANNHVSCEDIREWMGDLKHIRSVGKFAARMGQCFTTTRQLSGVSVPKVVQIEDIECQTDGHVWKFTDGVGKISPFFAKMIAHEQNMLAIPSCFQFRMGGCKGVLVEWRDVDAWNEVHIRPSQEKFKAPYNGLEIIKVSTFSHATLNRQIIPILSCLGVQDQVFMDLLNEELEEYESALRSSGKASALLRQRVDENQTALILAEMADTFMDNQEPFMWTILRLWKCWALQRLKYKAAISVKKSALLFGCVDEIGVLRGHSKDTEGRGVQDRASLPQIFLQVPREGTDPNNDLSFHVVTGLCVVGRNPSLHPGDIRMVEAVDVPELRHLKNIVVFPQKGDRDIPSMCSGGDLDGDDFFVFWDERLLPREWDFPPMDHDASATAPAHPEQDVNIQDMCAFFAQYMKNDCVGVVATAHFAWADKLGPKSRQCLELARLHSMAVDYIKSGKAAVMQPSLVVKDSPHWMERKSRTYRSPKPVGRIYDRIHVEEFSPAYDMPFDSRILSRFEHTEEELAKATEIKARYDGAMRRLMGQHERPISEFEIWSTFILSKPRVGNDYKLQEQVGRDVAALKDRYRIQCGEAVTGMASKSNTFSYGGLDLQKLDRFVAAMYTVTHAQVQGQVQDVSDDVPMPLISFPWLFHRELARVALGGVPAAMWRKKEENDRDLSMTVRVVAASVTVPETDGEEVETAEQKEEEKKEDEEDKEAEASGVEYEIVDDDNDDDDDDYDLEEFATKKLRRD